MLSKQESRPLNKLIGIVLDEERKIRMQKIFWIYECYIYVINGPNEIQMVEPKIKCKFIPITLDNCHRVGDFREESRISQYRDKLLHKEIGYFAEYEGKMIGSYWATINKTEVPRVVKTYFRLMPNEGLLHDNVVSEKFRGMGVGPFMTSSMIPLLFKEYGLSRMMTDINVKNHASLRMAEKVGLRIDRRMLYVSAFGRLILQVVLKKYV
jgi:GNAT superfamily N-acetyltransferase